MQIGRLFDLFTDAKDLADFFEGVETKEQLVSRLELLKRQGTEDLLACLVALPVTLDRLYTDTLEMSSTFDLEGEGEDEVGNDIDKDLEEIASQLSDETEGESDTVVENENSAAKTVAAEPKNDVSSAG